MALFAGLLWGVDATLAQTTAAGHLPGEFSVDATGAATYLIPLEVPPGAAGVQAELGLLYNSRAGNGQLGVGWSVTGLSAITRCPDIRDAYGVNHTGGVTLSASDRFCLDGQPLRAQGGTYGAPNTVYLTEIQTFQYVTSHGQVKGAPAHFVVVDRAGLKRFYGQTSNSRILSRGSPVSAWNGHPIVWALNRIEDKHGNYITFSYGSDTTLGEYWPTQIDWFNNQAQRLGRVSFAYNTTRPDKIFGYGYGRTRQSLTRRLTHIQVNEGASSAVRRYVLSYAQGTLSGLSQLSAVQLCAGTGSSVCLPPTEFQWTQGERGVITTPLVTAAPGGTPIKWLDANGDGRLDAVVSVSGQIRVYFAKNNGAMTIASGVPTGSHLPLQHAVVLDWNGNGMNDLLVPNTSTGFWNLYRATGTGFVYETTSHPHYNAHSGQVSAFDITGNGVSELFFRRDNHLHVYRGADGGGFVPGTVDTGFFISPGQRLLPMQFDGDGRPELLVTQDGCPEYISIPEWGIHWPNPCYPSVGPLKWDPTGNTLVRPWPLADIGDKDFEDPRLLDINGDGLTDIVVRVGTQVRVYLNKGGRMELAWTGLSNVTHAQWQSAIMHDWTLSGTLDVLVPRANNLFQAISMNGETVTTPTTTISSSGSGFMSADWNGDGLADIIVNSGGSWRVQRHRGSKSDHLRLITNGLGDELAISYVAVTAGSGDDALYLGHEASDASTATPRVRDFLGPIFAVESFAADAGIDTGAGVAQKVVTRYRYGGAKLNQYGRGFLGFRRVVAHNLNTGIVTENVHFQEFPYTGMVEQAIQRMPDTVTVEEFDWEAIAQWIAANCTFPFDNCNIPAPGMIVNPGPVVTETVATVARHPVNPAQTTSQVVFPYVSGVTERQFEFTAGGGTSVFRRTVTSNVYDTNGNPTQINVTVDNGSGGDTHTINTSNTYQPYQFVVGSWPCQSRLTSTTVTQTAPGKPSLSRQANFAYAPGHCQLTSEVSLVGTPQQLTRSYTFDSFGNRHTETVSGAGISPARTTTTTFDAKGRYAVQISNALGHVQQMSWHQGLAVMLSSTDPNGLVTSWQYDPFGRETKVTSPRSTQFTDTVYARCQDVSGGCQHGEAALRITRTGSGSSSAQTLQIVELDRLGREVATGERNVMGHMVYALSFYDAAGRVYARSGPYRPGIDSGACWTVRFYDPLGRVREEYAAATAAQCDSLSPPPPEWSFSGWSQSIVTYAGLTTATVDAEGRERERTVNVMDRLRFAREHDGTAWRTTTFDYDSLGNTLSVQDPAGVTANMTYDIAGRRLTMNDPNMGNWSYAYNAAGELTSQTDAKSVTVTMTYDALGRIKTRSEPEGTTTWTYDGSGHGPSLGRLTDIQGPHGFRERYWYETTGGELRRIARRIDNIWHWTTYDINALGQVSRVRYPAVDCAAPCSSEPSHTVRLRVDQYYRHGHLYLVRERRPDGTTGTRYWEALQVDALGAVTREKLGNDRFTLRYVNPATGLVENIATGTASQATSLQDLSMQWNRVGDLTRRTDHKVDRREDVFYDGMGRMTQVQRRTAAGSMLDTQAFTYGPTGNLLSKDVFSNYQYHANRPNAVQSVSGPGGTRGYQYDANGNLTSVTGPAPRTVTWWSHNKPRRMTRNADNYSEYWYGPGGDRGVFKQESRIAGALSTVVYGSALYERRTQGSTVEHTHYIQANGVTVATVRRYGTATANTTRYLHRDHLGSVVLITNESGAVSETLAYDAWGKRRPPTNWITPGAGTFLHAQWLRRGFTAHEHIDHVGLIHMGGRVYDPEIGRFLSPDPFVQYPGSAQGMNRYAYVGNNPLSFTDPSGYFRKTLKKIGKAVGFAMNFVPGMQFSNVLLHGFVSGFLVGGGRLKSGLMGMASAGLASRIGGIDGLNNLTRSALHGLAQGAVTRAGGGRFGDGALGAFAGSALSFIPERVAGPYGAGGEGAKIARMVAAATVGGTASAIGGGKFANGAWTAAFVSRFNHDGTASQEGFANPGGRQDSSHADPPAGNGIGAREARLGVRVIGWIRRVLGLPDPTGVASAANRVGGAVVNTGIAALDVDVANGVHILGIRSNTEACIAAGVCSHDVDRVVIQQALAQRNFPRIASVYNERGWEYQSHFEMLRRRRRGY